MKVRIDPDLCAGHGRCYSLAPEVFESDELGHGLVVLQDVPPELRAQAETGMQNCPEQAISVVEG